MTAVHIEIGTRHTAHVFGPQAWNMADAAQVPRMRCPRCKAMTIPANRAQDLATFIELRGKPVVVDAVLV
jgi:hypothetical protein